MFETLKSMVIDCLTENDNKSFCPFRVAGAALSTAGIPTFLGSSIYQTYKTGTFDVIAFGTGFAAMMGGLAVLAGGIAIKARTDKE